MNKNSEVKISTRSDLGLRRRGWKFSTEHIFAILLLVFAIGFNLWLYRLEPTANVDPNDNTFQFALVYRTNQMWDFANKTCAKNITFPICHFSYLADHWVPNWNEGFNLPYYYSHIPQIVIVGTYRFFHWFIGLFGYSFISLFAYYHLVIYFLLCFFPLSVFLAFLVLRMSPITAGIGALLASQISTDGLYGLDPPSFLWRGYGLSSQLFAMIFLPLAIAYAYRYFRNHTNFLPAALFLILTTSGHLGIGMMAFLALIPLAYAGMQNFSLSAFLTQTRKLAILSIISIFFLSYWIAPAMLNDKFHNFSFWDPVWKFNSYGWKETVVRFLNGDLFDFGRLPFYTGLVFLGLFACIALGYIPLALLFLFFFLLYFGRTTWGGLIDLIPGMKEFHLSRFIVGVHLASIFLAPIGLSWMAEKTAALAQKFFGFSIKIITLIIFIIVITFLIYPQTIRYNDLNNALISRANTNYEAAKGWTNELVSTIQKLAPARVFTGRGGGWGHDFRVAETPMFMYLSNFAVPTVLWLPETWSPNGDTEQYFREDKAEDYDLYNIRWVAAPASQSAQPYWKEIKKTNAWKLYEVPTTGYFAVGARPAIVASDKYSFTNVERLWIQSSDHSNGLYPQLTFDTKTYPKNSGLPNFKMLDEVTYQVPDGSIHNLFAQPPKYMFADDYGKKKFSGATLIGTETVQDDMIFKTKVKVDKDCKECLVILKETYHPDWKATIDGVEIHPMTVFPFFLAVPVSEGTHEITFWYQPSGMKVTLIWLEIGVGISLAALFLYTRSK